MLNSNRKAFYIFLLMAVPFLSQAKEFSQLERTKNLGGLYYVKSDQYVVKDYNGNIIAHPPKLKKGVEITVISIRKGFLGNSYGYWGFVNDVQTYYIKKQFVPANGVYINVNTQDLIKLNYRFFKVTQLPDSNGGKSYFKANIGDTVYGCEVIEPKFTKIKVVKGSYLIEVNPDSIFSRCLTPIDIKKSDEELIRGVCDEPYWYEKIFYQKFMSYFVFICPLILLILILINSLPKVAIKNNHLCINNASILELIKLKGVTISSHSLTKVLDTVSYGSSVAVGNTVYQSMPIPKIKTANHSEIFVRINENDVILIKEPYHISVYNDCHVSLFRLKNIKTNEVQNVSFHLHEPKMLYKSSEYSLIKFLKWKIPFKSNILTYAVLLGLSFFILFQFTMIKLYKNFPIIKIYDLHIAPLQYVLIHCILYSIGIYAILKILEQVVLFLVVKFKISRLIKNYVNSNLI